ncbi:hypothetical protein ACF1BU_24060 [Streptomyces sp. NPDC014724]|uniref:hypothetical protein n=1 Tax=unclassified Streptomyces TaxID=2593676 RepID=UPI0036FB2A7A
MLHHIDRHRIVTDQGTQQVHGDPAMPQDNDTKVSTEPAPEEDVLGVAGKSG